MDSRHNIDAATGFGRFDLQLARNAGILNVIIKVRMVISEMVEPFRGTAIFRNEQTYMSDWQRNVNQLWSNKLTLRNPGIQKDVVVRFVLQRVTAGEHFTVFIVGNYDQGAGLKFAAVGADPANVGTGNLYLALGPNSNKTHANRGEAGMGNTRQTELSGLRDPVRQETGVDYVDVTLDRNGNAWTVAPASIATLNGFCTAIGTSGVTGQPIYVHAASGLKDKANALVTCVKQYIQGRGVTNQINTNPQKVRRKLSAPWTAHKSTATVRVELEDIDTAYQRYYGNYVVTAHEFGHLIGIPDEYLDYSTFTNQTIRNSQPNWDNLCGTWNLSTRNWHAQFNDSIMSIGTRIYPAHGATIIQALDDMTSQAPNALAGNSWTLVSPT